MVTKRETGSIEPFQDIPLFFLPLKPANLQVIFIPLEFGDIPEVLLNAPGLALQSLEHIQRFFLLLFVVAEFVRGQFSVMSQRMCKFLLQLLGLHRPLVGAAENAAQWGDQELMLAARSLTNGWTVGSFLISCSAFSSKD
jgi:hypothetical protein